MAPIFNTDQGPLAASSGNASRTVTPVMLDELVATRGWAILLAVLNWIFAGVALVAGYAVFSLSFARSLPVLRLISYAYFAIGIIAMVPALLLSRYAGALRRLRALRNERPLVEALYHERRLWKFAAIASLIILALFFAGSLTFAARYVS